MRPYGEYLKNQAVHLDEIVEHVQQIQGIANEPHHELSNGTKNDTFVNGNRTNGSMGSSGSGSTNNSGDASRLLSILNNLKAFGYRL